jgi:hypothetical protein
LPQVTGEGKVENMKILYVPPVAYCQYNETTPLSFQSKAKRNLDTNKMKLNYI